MIALKKWFKIIALFFTALILFQSCATYKTPVTLEQAANTEKAVKIITVDNDTYKYKYIVYEDGQFYGVKDNPGEDVKFPIDTEEAANLLMKNGGIPWWAWTLIGAALIGIIFLIVKATYGGPELNWSG